MFLSVYSEYLLIGGSPGCELVQPVQQAEVSVSLVNA